MSDGQYTKRFGQYTGGGFGVSKGSAQTKIHTKVKVFDEDTDEHDSKHHGSYEMSQIEVANKSSTDFCTKIEVLTEDKYIVRTQDKDGWWQREERGNWEDRYTPTEESTDDPDSSNCNYDYETWASDPED